MTTHHTPGPWRYEADIEPRKDGTQAMEFRLYGADETEIIGGCGCCGSPFMYGPAKANAQLIASAPELLTALTALLKERTPETIDQAQAVILKATGDKVEAGGQEKQTKAEQYRKTHARMGITSGGWNTERIIKSPDVPKHPSSNALANGWIFNDGSELWETDEGGIWSVYTTPAINK